MKTLFVLIVLWTSHVYALQLGFPQDTVAYNDKFNNRQSMALDSQGKVHIAYNGQVGTNAATSEIYYVAESGDSLITVQVTNNAVDDHYPTVCVDRNDDVHIGFEVRDASNLFQVVYTRLVNGVFTTPVFITQGGLNKATPYCAIGPDSVIHFVYHTFPPTGTQYLYYRKYDLRDSTLSPEQQLSEAGVTGDFDSAIAVDTAGFIHIVTKSGSAFGGPLKYFTNRTGTLLETPTGVTGNVDYPRVLVDKRNVVHILYRQTSSLILNVVNNASGSFGAPVPVTPAGQRPAGYQNFGVDDENRLYIVYQSSASASGRGWYLVHGKDGIFSDTLRVDGLTPVTRNTSAVVARGNGEIAVTYSPGGSRGGSVVCDIFMKRGILQTTDVEEGSPFPSTLVLEQNYPNPFNPTTHFRFRLPAGQAGISDFSAQDACLPDRQGSASGGGLVTLKIYDLLGREVATLVNEALAPGSYERSFDATGLASGVYLYRLQVHTRNGRQERDVVQTRKFVLLR